MPFEELDKQLKEAADQHFPDYDETAWAKMEMQLNRHMPVEKKERKRGIFWLLPIMLVAGGIGYFVWNPGMNKSGTDNDVIKSIGKEIPLKPVKSTSLPSENYSSSDQDIVVSNKNNLSNERQPILSTQTSVSPVFENIKQKNIAVQKKSKNGSQDVAVLNAPVELPQTINPSSSINIPGNQSPASNESTKFEDKPEDKKSVSPVSILTTQNPETEQTPEIPKTKTSVKKSRKGNGLFISLSAGPDVGAVHLNNLGKMETAGGVGIGYAFNKRFSVQTGFYKSRKIYTAGPKDYNPPSWWWIFYPNLEKVDGDCKVFEIPVLATYNFTNNKNGSWFGTAGLSSYLMKKESYQYHYKTGSGQPVTRSWAYYNENKHILSVITLAGGYEKKINKNFSASVSPYIKMPWQGVGFGKIKLNSGGIMVSAILKPFAQ